jgi:hypothetical protein
MRNVPTEPEVVLEKFVKQSDAGCKAYRYRVLLVISSMRPV